MTQSLDNDPQMLLHQVDLEWGVYRVRARPTENLPLRARIIDILKKLAEPVQQVAL